MTYRKSGRNTDGTIAPGNPGKPKGTRHKATQAALAMLEEGDCIRAVEESSKPQGGGPQRLLTVNPALHCP